MDDPKEITIGLENYIKLLEQEKRKNKKLEEEINFQKKRLEKINEDIKNLKI